MKKQESLRLLSTLVVIDLFITLYNKRYGMDKLKEVMQKIEGAGELRSYAKTLWVDGAYPQCDAILSIINNIPYFHSVKPETWCCGVLVDLQSWRLDAGQRRFEINEDAIKNCVIEIIAKADHHFLFFRRRFFTRFYNLIGDILEQRTDINRFTA